MFTRTDIIVMVLGLFGGYVAVSWLIGKLSVSLHARPKGEADAKHGSARAESAQGEPQQPPKSSNNRTRPWHEVLCVPRIATLDEVKRAYRQRMSEYHPDKVVGLGVELRSLAEAKAKEINVAYDTALRAFGKTGG